MHPRQRTRFGAAFIALWLVCNLAAASHAQEAAKSTTPPPRDAPANATITPGADSDPSARIEVGLMAPDFELDASNGKAIRLSSLRGNWVALVFNDRMAPLTKYGKIDDDLQRMGVKLVTVCREKTRYVRAMSRRENLPFLVLADVSGQVGSLYGLRSERGGDLTPGLLMIDTGGRVKLIHTGEALTADRMWQVAHDFMTSL